ncbi:MAG: O-antigen ligase family protein [Flavobacteriales bacterium]|nr:O-antigen ligase family protein [Flavobacteriales bacterium]
MFLTLKNYIISDNKGKRNAIFVLLLVFGFPTIAIINYATEIQSGIISQAYRMLNLIISGILILEFLVKTNFKLNSKISFNKDFLIKKAPFILFLIFWMAYLLRLYIDLEINHITNAFNYSNSYYFLFAIGVTIIPMLAVASIKEFDVDFFQLSLHRYLVVLNIGLVIIFFLGKLFNPAPDYRFFIIRDEFYYLDAITIAIYGSLLVLTSFLSKKKNLFTYLLIALGFFIVLTTASRGPILSLLLALFFIFIFIDKKISFKYLYLTIALIFSMIANYVTSLIFVKEFIVGNPMLYRINNMEEDQSTVSRLDVLNEGIQQFLEGPIFGSHFLVVKSSMYAHNIFFDVLLTTGIFGLLLIIPIFLIFAKKMLSPTKTIILSVLGFYLFLNTLTSGACYNMTEFWIIFALTIVYKKDLINNPV